MKIDEIRSKDITALRELLLDELRALAELRLRRGVDEKIDYQQFRVLRKNIARVKTIINEKTRQDSYES